MYKYYITLFKCLSDPCKKVVPPTVSMKSIIYQHFTEHDFFIGVQFL